MACVKVKPHAGDSTHVSIVASISFSANFDLEAKVNRLNAVIAWQ